MAHRLVLLLISLLIASFGAAGCGGDDEESSGSSGGTTTEESSTTEDAPSTDDPALSDAQRKQAEESCKQAITAQSQLSRDVKADLEEICEEAAKGDEDAVRKATKEVCVKIVEDTAPAGPARDQAFMACDQATTP